MERGSGVPAGRPRWEIYGDPDTSTGDFHVDVFWLLAVPPAASPDGATGRLVTG
jgi:hypothetical protein